MSLRFSSKRTKTIEKYVAFLAMERASKYTVKFEYKSALINRTYPAIALDPAQWH